MAQTWLAHHALFFTASLYIRGQSRASVAFLMSQPEMENILASREQTEDGVCLSGPASRDSLSEGATQE